MTHSASANNTVVSTTHSAVDAQNCGLTAEDIESMTTDELTSHVARNHGVVTTHMPTISNEVANEMATLFVVSCCCGGTGASLSEATATRMAREMGCSEVQVIKLTLTEWPEEAEPDWHWSYLSPLVGNWAEGSDLCDLWSNLDYDETRLGMTLAPVVYDHRVKSSCEVCDADWI